MKHLLLLILACIYAMPAQASVPHLKNNAPNILNRCQTAIEERTAGHLWARKITAERFHGTDSASLMLATRVYLLASPADLPSLLSQGGYPKDAESLRHYLQHLTLTYSNACSGLL